MIFLMTFFLSLHSFGAKNINQTIQDINWSELKMPFIRPVVTNQKYYKVSFFDDFKGKPDSSANSQFCFDTLKPQCTIWSGLNQNSQPCDFSNLPLTDNTPTPPLRANIKNALYSLDQNLNLETKTLSELKTLYTNTLNEKWKHVNKCNWQSYQMVNWMATDYNGNFSAKMDASQVTVDPSGKGYLVLSARKGKVLESCAFGGTVGPTVKPWGPFCLLKDVSSAITGPVSIYWVDANPASPGIFYNKISGGCPYGGSGSVNCRVYSFAPAELIPTFPYKIIQSNGTFYASYPSMYKYACNHSIEYPNGGVAFNKISCPILNGGILSQKFIDSTGITNGFIQKHGIFEVKLKIPKGRGAFPAAWLLPSKGGWPYSGGEIDIIEARDNADEVYQTFHQGKCIDAQTKDEIIYNPNNPSQFIDNGGCQNISNAVSINYSRGKTIPQAKTNEFFSRDHVYTADWSDEKIEWFVNNHKSNVVAPGVSALGFHINNPLPGLTTQNDIPLSLQEFDTHNMPHDPFYWILNHSTWVANEYLPNWAEQHLYIDYVKVYNRCVTQNDFCPNGGQFVEGTGCVITNSSKTDVSKSSSTVYQSQCSEKFKARTCPAGGDIAGPNCGVHSFQKPHVVPGVNYWLDTNPNYPGVYYQKVNNSCPHGGSAGVNCHFEGLSPIYNGNVNENVIPGINYWVDTNPSWPGIYYAKINGNCPIGGSGSVNCQLRSFPANFLKSFVKYWVDTNPSWPGIYYKKINGACPYGGSGAVNCQLLSLKTPNFYLNPQVSYWLDTDPRYPGIYYAKINNTCPYGGAVGVNCQLKAYPVPTQPYLTPKVNYWVDTDKRWPGVYYKPINGTCPYGGAVGVNCQLISFPQDKLDVDVNYWVDSNPLWPGVYYEPDFR
jgi:beta-glucanase (GH16 family)